MDPMSELASDPIWGMNWGPARVEEVVALVAAESFAALRWTGVGCPDECPSDCLSCIRGSEIARVLADAMDERDRYRFEADEAAKQLLSARIDALNEAATLLESRATKGHREFAHQIAQEIRGLR